MKMVGLDFYQQNALRTAPVDQSFEFQFGNYAMGITGEGGEVADIVKKVLYHGHPLDLQTADKIAKELGDVLWYVANMAHLLGFTLSEVASMNIEKLKQRFPDGFTSERSMNRKRCVHQQWEDECLFCMNLNTSLDNLK